MTLRNMAEVAMSRMEFADDNDRDGDFRHRKWNLECFRNVLWNQVLLALIFVASILLLILEVFSIEGLGAGRGMHIGIFVIEGFLDVLIFADVIRRARGAKSCDKYMRNVWNWVDLLTVWIILVHWVIVILYPFFQLYSDAWILIRYGITGSRVVYWMIRNFFYFRYQYYNQVPVDSVGGMEWLPERDLDDDADAYVFDDDDDDARRSPDFIIHQFIAPNAVNANEIAKAEKNAKLDEKASIEAQRSKDREFDDVLGASSDEGGDNMVSEGKAGSGRANGLDNVSPPDSPGPKCIVVTDAGAAAAAGNGRSDVQASSVLRCSDGIRPGDTIEILSLAGSVVAMATASTGTSEIRSGGAGVAATVSRPTPRTHTRSPTGGGGSLELVSMSEGRVNLDDQPHEDDDVGIDGQVVDSVDDLVDQPDVNSGSARLFEFEEG